MKYNMLTHFIFEINRAIDTGKHQGITVAEVEKHIEAGSLFEFLKTTIPGLDLSLMDASVRAELAKELKDLLGGYKGDERRKWGIENSGLCLLVAWAAETIQQKARKELGA